jgi:hypothetical protein
MKHLAILIGFTFSAGFLFAQEEEDDSQSRDHAVGMHVGATTGIGFSYRYWPEKVGFQLTAVPFFNSRNENNFLSIGGSVFYKFLDTRKSDLYGYLGTHYVKVSQFDPRHSVGFGFGANLYPVVNRFYFSLQAGYGIFRLNDKPFSFLTGEFGVYFKF